MSCIGTSAGGSPPHTRGIRDYVLHWNECRRFTPAYAGNTRQHRHRRKNSRVHPRIRGEYIACVFLFTIVLGSPPHTRGIPPGHGLQSLFQRFTPAYAGNTLDRECSVKRTEVHPRIRGEYKSPLTSPLVLPGSPPHTRGIHLGYVSCNQSKGFTPPHTRGILS